MFNNKIHTSQGSVTIYPTNTSPVSNRVTFVETDADFQKKVAVSRWVTFVAFLTSPLWGIALVEALVSNVPSFLASFGL